MLFLSWAIMFGHNIVPHHHHATESELAHHHHTEHKENHDGGNDLEHILSHFLHSADGFTFTTNHSIHNVFSKQLILFAALLPVSFSLNEFFIPPLLYKPPAQRFTYTAPASLSPGLRAPPFFIS